MTFSGAGKDVSSFKATPSFQAFPKIKEDEVSILFPGRYRVSVPGDVLPETPCSSCAVPGAGATLWATAAGPICRGLKLVLNSIDFRFFKSWDLLCSPMERMTQKP